MDGGGGERIGEATFSIYEKQKLFDNFWLGGGGLFIFYIDWLKARLKNGYNPKMSNPKMSNPKMSNPKMLNPKMSNPKMSNPKMSNLKC